MFDFLEHPSDMYMNSTMRGLFIASLIMVYVVYKKGSRLDKISLVVAFLFAWPFWMVLFFTNGPLSVYHAVTAMFAAGYTMIIFYPLTLIVIWLFRKPIPPKIKTTSPASLSLVKRIGVIVSKIFIKMELWRSCLNLAQRIIVSLTGSVLLAFIIFKVVNTIDIDDFSLILWIGTIILIGACNFWIFSKPCPP